MRGPKEVLFLAGEFYRYATGTDYFRQKQGLGSYFADPRCYYNDLRHKAYWNGACINGVPALHLVSSGQDVVFPIMAILYGLGSLDCYFLKNDPAHLDAVRRVATWLPRGILPQGYFDNGFAKRDPSHEYYSENSAMCQGLAISFAARALQYDLLKEPSRTQLRELVAQILTNMLLPVQEQGTALYQGDDLYFLEDTEKHCGVVLNGWIFAVFGLFDYLRLGPHEVVTQRLAATLATMKRALPRYRLASGWSYYDTLGRISSPFYHDLHISQLDALHRLTGAAEFATYRDLFRKSNGRVNKIRYTLNKIKDRLLDKNALGT